MKPAKNIHSIVVLWCPWGFDSRTLSVGWIHGCETQGYSGPSVIFYTWFEIITNRLWANTKKMVQKNRHFFFFFFLPKVTFQHDLFWGASFRIILRVLRGFKHCCPQWHFINFPSFPVTFSSFPQFPQDDLQNKLHQTPGLNLCFYGESSNVGDLGSIPGLGRSPGGGNGNPFQYSCLENPLG